MLKQDYPSAIEELPFTNNELQRLVPLLLREILYLIWSDRTDLFFGLHMSYYHNPSEPAIVPDGFLSIGAEKYKTFRQDHSGRLNYVLWEEEDVVPILVIDCVSQTYRGEYDEKKLEYARLGILYYVIYNSKRYYLKKGKRKKGNPLEVHRLENGVYVRQEGQPVWLPEIGLGIGIEQGTFHTWTREWLYWYNQEGVRYLSPEEMKEEERARAGQEKDRADREKARADLEKARADREKKKASREKNRANQTQFELEQEQARADKTQQQFEQLRAKLQQRGINWEDMLD